MKLLSCSKNRHLTLVFDNRNPQQERLSCVISWDAQWPSWMLHDVILCLTYKQQHSDSVGRLFHFCHQGVPDGQLCVPSPDNAHATAFPLQNYHSITGALMLAWCSWSIHPLATAHRWPVASRETRPSYVSTFWLVIRHSVPVNRVCF